MRLGTGDRTKAEKHFEKIRHRLEMKIDRLQPKIKDLTNRKAESR